MISMRLVRRQDNYHTSLPRHAQIRLTTTTITTTTLSHSKHLTHSLTTTFPNIKTRSRPVSFTNIATLKNLIPTNKHHTRAHTYSSTRTLRHRHHHSHIPDPCSSLTVPSHLPSPKGLVNLFSDEPFGSLWLLSVYHDWNNKNRNVWWGKYKTPLPWRFFTYHLHRGYAV